MTRSAAHPSLRAAVRAHTSIVAFGAAYFVGFVSFGVMTGRPSTLSYAFAMIVLFAGVAAVDRRVGLSQGLLWALAAWGCAHMAGGLIGTGGGQVVLYNADLHVPALHYDRVVHAFGFGAATVVCWEALRSAMPVERRVTPGLAVGIALMGMGLGALNEMIEFVDTHLMNSNVGGYQNTGWDLVFNTIGCAIAAGWLLWRGSVRATDPANAAGNGGVSPGVR